MKTYSALFLVCTLASCSAPESDEATAIPSLSHAAAPAVDDTLQAQNPDQSGFITTPSGLKYKVLTPGTGRRPIATDQVTVHYRGTLLDGTEFDSSYKRNEPTTFPLNQVIPGWTEGVQLMQEGAKYEFIIPSRLAYGSQGSPPNIGPNETLNFVVELLRVQ